MTEKRIAALLAAAGPAKTGHIIYKPENIRYFSGFTGEGFLYITSDALCLVTDSRYTEQAGKQAPLFRVYQTNPLSEIELMKKLVSENPADTVSYEDEYISAKQFSLITSALKGANLVPAGGIAESLRAVKDESEIASVRRACELADMGAEFLARTIRPGMTEKRLALELDFYLCTNGSEKPSFSTIVASGANGSMPHAIPGDKPFEKGELITIDFGCTVEGYASDMTRTFALGQVSDTLRSIYDITLRAHMAALTALRPGMKGCEADAIARDLIKAEGYGSNFGHGLGHGVGLEIHESPRLAPTASYELRAGNFVTVEPGIYLPGIGGVRIEDTVLITENGYESMFRSDKELIVL